MALQSVSHFLINVI